MRASSFHITVTWRLPSGSFSKEQRRQIGYNYSGKAPVDPESTIGMKGTFKGLPRSRMVSLLGIGKNQSNKHRLYVPLDSPYPLGLERAG